MVGVLTSLVDKGSVERVADGAEGATGPCFSLRAMLREHALALQTEAEVASACGAHTAFVAGVVVPTATGVAGVEQEGWLDRTKGEHDNLPAARG